MTMTGLDMDFTKYLDSITSIGLLLLSLGLIMINQVFIPQCWCCRHNDLTNFFPVPANVTVLQLNNYNQGGGIGVSVVSELLLFHICMSFH